MITNQNIADAQPRTLLTVSQFAEKHPAFTQSSLRYHIFHSKTRNSSLGEIPGNGLDVALIRLGRKLLIDEDRFFEWIANQNAKGDRI